MHAVAKGTEHQVSEPALFEVDITACSFLENHSSEDVVCNLFEKHNL